MPEALRAVGTHPVAGSVHRASAAVVAMRVSWRHPRPCLQTVPRYYPGAAPSNHSRRRRDRPWGPDHGRGRADPRTGPPTRLRRGRGRALPVGAGLGPVAADLHRAPLARPVAGRVVEGPPTVVGRTDLDPVEPAFDGDLG